MNSEKWNSYKLATREIHVGQDSSKWKTKDVVPPICLSTTFVQDEPTSFSYVNPTNDDGYEYGRCANPTRDTLEQALASIEKSKYALTFASGISAITSLIYLIKSGDHIIAVDDVYSGVSIFLKSYATKMNIETSFVNMLDIDEVEKSFRPNTAMVWFEPCTNPTLKLIDIKAICEITRRKNPNILIGVDNTFCSPHFLNPLELGADITMHSVTKYLNGHSDVLMGAIMLNSLDLFEKIKSIQEFIGAVPSPFDCFLVNRSLKTFSLRMEKHMSNGMKVAAELETNPRIERVLYPGLESHPQHHIYKKQMRGFGGMMSFYIKGGLEETKKFLKALKIITLAVSLGGYESLIELPCIQTHRSVAYEQRMILGITDNFLRFSVGLEDPEDLINDLNEALLTAVKQLN